MGHFANNIQSICTAGKMLLILSLLLTLLSSGISRPSLKGTPIDEIINGLPKVAETLTDEFNWHKEVIDKEITSENDEKMQGPEVSEPVETISEAGEAEKQEIIVETNMESFELNIPPAEMPAESYQEVQPENEHLDAELETEHNESAFEPIVDPLEPAAETLDNEPETEPYEPAAEEAETSESEAEPEVEPVAETLDNESETEPYEPVEEEAEISESEVEPEDEPAAETSESEVEPEDEPASETSASESETEPYEPAAEEAETSEGNNVTVMEESEPKEDVVPEDEPDQPDDMEPKAESDASNM